MNHDPQDFDSTIEARRSRMETMFVILPSPSSVQQVAVGDELFLIEPDQYRSVVKQRETDVAKAVADAKNADGGYDRIVGAMANLSYTLSDQTVGNIFQRQGIPPAPARQRSSVRACLCWRGQTFAQ